MIKPDRAFLSVLLACALCVSGPVFSAEEEYGRGVLNAIRLYNSGDYETALDRFMDVLMTSDSAKDRAAANKYINRINQRLSDSDVGHSERTDQIKDMINTESQVDKSLRKKPAESTKIETPAVEITDRTNRPVQGLSSGGEKTTTAPDSSEKASGGSSLPRPAVPPPSTQSLAPVPAALDDVAAAPKPVKVAKAPVKEASEADLAEPEPDKTARPAPKDEEPADETPADKAPAKTASKKAVKEDLDTPDAPPDVEASGPAVSVPVASAPKARVTSVVPAAVRPAGATGLQGQELADWIKKKLAEMRTAAINDLAKEPGVKIIMRNGLPAVISFPSSLVFRNKLEYVDGAETLLYKVSAVMFTLGEAAFTVLPDGAAAKELQIQDMRRAMSLVTWFSGKGLSPARIKADLTLESSRDQKELSNIKGMIILCDYKAVPQLKQMAGKASNDPPMLSLGVWPGAIDVKAGEGAIVEFSALQTSFKIDNWKLQIFQYFDGQFVLVKENTGEGPTYHQLYWNAREGFTGTPLGGGKYVVALTVIDSAGQKEKARKIINVTGAPKPEPIKLENDDEDSAPAVKKGVAAKRAAKKPARRRSRALSDE